MRFTHRPGWSSIWARLPPHLPPLTSSHLAAGSAGTEHGSLVPRAGPQPWVPWRHRRAKLTVYGRHGREMGSSVTMPQTDSSAFSHVGWPGNEEVHLIVCFLMTITHFLACVSVTNPSLPFSSIIPGVEGLGLSHGRRLQDYLMGSRHWNSIVKLRRFSLSCWHITFFLQDQACLFFFNYYLFLNWTILWAPQAL